MSRVEDLIQQLCQDGVEFKEIQEIFTLRNGYTPSKADISFWEGGTVPWFRMEDIRENGRVLDDSMQHIPESAVKGGRLFAANSIIVATSATIGEHALITVPFLSNQRFTCLTVKPELENRFDIKFVYYYCFVLNDWCLKNTTTSSFASVDMSKFKRFKFPIPPVEVQRQIISILDRFTSLEADLEADLEGELKARQRQFVHYRSFLVPSVGDDVEWSTLDQLASNCDSRRRPVTKGAREPGDIPYYGASGIVDYVSRFIFDGDYLLVSEDGANLLARSTPIAFSISGKTWVNNHAHILQFDTHARRRFVEIYLNSIDLVPYVTGGAQPKLNQSNLNRIPIPNPPLQEQERIVAVLDKFDALVNALSFGLPTELRARRAQYEYYRHRLLTFDEVYA